MEISNVAPRAGMISALTIPTDRDGKIIEAGLKRNMDWLKKSKVDAFLVLGSTGEFPRFSTAEKKDILAKTALINGGEVPLIANCASCDTRETIELAQFAEKSGYSGISLMPQYFCKPSKTFWNILFTAIHITICRPCFTIFPNLQGRK